MKDEEFCNYEAKINQAKGNDYFAKSDYKQAEIYYNKACKNYKSREACIDYMKGGYYYDLGYHQYKTQANYYFKKACEKDKDGDICKNIGMLLYIMDITEYYKNYLNKACEKDKSGDICAKIADYLDDKDYYKKACQKNQKYCDYNGYNDYIAKGREFFEKEDYKQAEFYLKQACEKEKKKKGEYTYREDYCEDYNRYGVGMYLLFIVGQGYIY